MNRVWIELDKPKSKEHAEIQCELGNRMLKRLGMHPSVGFRYNATKNQYNLTINSADEYLELVHNGHSFNLDFLGREDD